MKENLIIYSCKEGSTSAKELAAELDCRCIQRSDNTNVREIPRGALVVCYGMGYMPQWAEGKNVRYLNNPDAVARKISKIWQLNRFLSNDVPTLEFTRAINNARMWLRQGHHVFARSDTGMDGNGITILGPTDTVPVASFYTKMFHNSAEYRLHVFNGRVIDTIKRKRTYRDPVANTLQKQMIRSWDNGWVFTHEFRLSATQRQALEQASTRAVAAIGLDFGAVDILLNAEGDVAVCEVNSAPGLVYDETFEAYKTAILEVYNER